MVKDNVRRSIVSHKAMSGHEPLQAIQMVTLTAAEAFRVDHLVGSLTPGRTGDVLLVDDLETLSIHSVYANGKLVFGGGARPWLWRRRPTQLVSSIR